jgi:putative ATP-dependent endonuclease of the OLD family
MKINQIEIKNFRSLHDLTIRPKDLTALIGRNNSGKSNVIKALQIFFEASTKLISSECFHLHLTDNPIRIIVSFNRLNEWEKQEFSSWMLDEETLVVGRQIVCSGENDFEIVPIAIKQTPEPEWLRTENVTSEKIKEWWDTRDSLKINGLDFSSTLGDSKPSIGKWKELIESFTAANITSIPFIKVEVVNPKGYPNVLKGALPQFIYIPAVRNVLDEAKVTQNSPFGKLLSSVLRQIGAERIQRISDRISEVESFLNRTQTGERIAEISAIETRLNTLMSDLMDCDLELELPMPRLQEVLTGARIYANDGVRTLIEAKGHGLQRSLIFTILRAYSELISSSNEQQHQRSTVFAFEEPELYLHPQAERTLMGLFRRISDGPDQIFYSTHSSLFVDIGHFDEICLMKSNRTTVGLRSTVQQLDTSDFITDLLIRKGITATAQGIREQYLNAFDSSVNEGFFAEKVIIVEGASEGYSLPIYSNALGYDLDRNNVSVVYADGKGQMDRLLRVFSGFQLPTYLIFDGDKSNTDNEVKRKSIELLELLGNPITDIRILQTIISDTFAVLEEKLEVSLQTVITDYSQIISQGSATLGPMGKPLTNKWIAIELSRRAAAGNPEQILPRFIIDIVNAIRRLNTPSQILRRD